MLNQNKNPGEVPGSREVPDQEGVWRSEAGDPVDVYRLDPVGGVLCVWGPDIGITYTGATDTQRVWQTDAWQGHVPVWCLAIRQMGPWHQDAA